MTDGNAACAFSQPLQKWPSIVQKAWQGRVFFYSTLPEYSEKSYELILGISKKVSLKFSSSKKSDAGLEIHWRRLL